MAKFNSSSSKVVDPLGVTQSHVNPWISDRSLGSIRNALQLAKSTGHLRKDSLLDQEDNTKDAYDSMPSLKMLSVLREITSLRQQLSEVNFEIQKHLQDRETQDITHEDVLEQRIAKISELNSHLEEIIKNKQLLVARIQQPFVNDYVPVELPYQRYTGELLPQVMPTLSELSTNLENLEWAVQLNTTLGDLGGLLGDVASTVGTHQAVRRSIEQLRGTMRQLETQRGIVDQTS